VLALSRQQADPPVPAGARLTAWSVDLADAVPVAERLVRWLGEQDTAALRSATLINNAGVVSQLAPLSAVAADDLVRALRVGLEAPTLLTAAFLRATGGWTVPRKVLLVSSGLGRRAMAGSASYCAAKAGLDHLARAVALEEQSKPNGARIVSLAPGVIDTDMQVQLRSADATLFPERERFIGLQVGGQLDSPAAAAAKLLEYLDRPSFGEPPVGDVRDA
jgi:NAD(P)-dependent dehydrogenase (short-subunit alcohol dehydrogenase family)